MSSSLRSPFALLRVLLPASFACALIAGSVVSCTSDDGDTNEPDVAATDGGEPDAGPEGNRDGGTPEPGANPETPEPGANPETPEPGANPETPEPGAGPTDGGFPQFDGGLSEYDGDAEDGVRCGNALEACDVGAPCCVEFAGFSLQAQCGDVPAAGEPQTCPAYTMGCDDTQTDCSDGDVCCFVLQAAIPLTMYSQCMPQAECDAIDADPDQPDSTNVCINTSDCEGGQLCCGVEVQGFDVPIDMGVCRDDCEL